MIRKTGCSCNGGGWAADFSISLLFLEDLVKEGLPTGKTGGQRQHKMAAFGGEAITKLFLYHHFWSMDRVK